MSANIIVSYDGTNNEDDAIALGQLLADAGGQVSLAYVRHAPEAETSREILAQHEAEQLLARGAELLTSSSEVSRYVVSDRSTPEGLNALAERIGADLIVFCSDSHTAKGHVAIGNSAQRLLNGGTKAVAIAPAGFAQSAVPVNEIGVVGDGTAHTTAEALATALGVQVNTTANANVGLLVVGSRPEAQDGQVSLSAASENVIAVANCPVLVLPHGRALAFARPVAAV
jgi:nucleotide-binding universal stress UspA family protein